MSDIQRMNGTFESPDSRCTERAVLTGKAPVASMRNYWTEVASYTQGTRQTFVRRRADMRSVTTRRRS